MAIDEEKKRFTELYNQEADRLFRFCFLRVSDREKALDITQESFTRLWSSISAGKKRDQDHARAFLFVTARNLIIDWYRRIKAQSLEAMSNEEEGVEFDPPDERSALEMELSADAKRVLALLDNLEAQYREVVYFRFIEDLPPKEIAEIMGLNANTVSVRLTRSLEELRKLLKIKKDED